MKKRGRPCKDNKEKKIYRLELRLTFQEKMKIRRLAVKLGTNPSDAVLKAVEYLDQNGE